MPVRTKPPERSHRPIGIDEAAARIGMTPAWVKRHLDELPSYKLGRRRVFDPTKLDRWFEGQAEGPNV